MNAWVLFCLYREGHPEAITRPTGYSHAAFTDALIRQLAGIPLNADVTIASKQLFMQQRQIDLSGCWSALALELICTTWKRQQLMSDAGTAS